jgi:hypothetical protein
MAITPPLITNSLTQYLNQWVKIASGDRVKLTGSDSSPDENSGTRRTHANHWI